MSYNDNRINCLARGGVTIPLTNSSLSNVSAGTVGAIGELIVASDLLRRGWDVFRSISPSCNCDLIIKTRECPICYRVEVTSGCHALNGKITRPTKDTSKFDILAIVFPDNSIHYEPESPKDHGFKRYEPISHRTGNPVGRPRKK